MKKVMERIIPMVVGSLLTIVGYHFGTIDNDSANAQIDIKAEPVLTDGEFNTVRCRNLEILDTDSNTRIVLTDTGQILILDENGEVGMVLTVVDRKGVVIVGKTDSKSNATLHAGEYGGMMSISNKKGEVVLQTCVTENGAGLLKIWDKFGDKLGEIGPPGKFQYNKGKIDFNKVIPRY